MCCLCVFGGDGACGGAFVGRWCISEDVVGLSPHPSQRAPVVMCAITDSLSQPLTVIYVKPEVQCPAHVFELHCVMAVGRTMPSQLPCISLCIVCACCCTMCWFANLPTCGCDHTWRTHTAQTHAYTVPHMCTRAHTHIHIHTTTNIHMHLQILHAHIQCTVPRLHTRRTGPHRISTTTRYQVVDNFFRQKTSKNNTKQLIAHRKMVIFLCCPQNASSSVALNW